MGLLLPSRASPDQRRILLAATMRNEGPYILEWVAYHRAIGFTDIVICTNDCIDGSPALLDRMQTLGLVTHVATIIAPGAKPQLAAYDQAGALPQLAAADWAMVLDADEFLNVHVGNEVRDLIDAVPSATAFLINWRLFGNSGHDRWRPEFVTRRFTRAAKRQDAVNLSFKSLFRKIELYGCKLMPHQPRYPCRDKLDALHYVDGGGTALPAYFADESRDSFLQSEPGSVDWTLAQVNHYNTRSRDDYLVKHQRGGGLNIDWDAQESWAIFNKNDETDLSIADKLPAAQEIFDAFLKDWEIRSCHQRCCALYGHHVARLAALRGRS